MKCQKELFRISDNIHYLNCAYKAPLLKTSEEVAIRELVELRNPTNLSPDDFFVDSKQVRNYFSELVKSSPSNIAIVPSTSYGFSSVLNNIKGKRQGNAVTIHDEFPSGYFSIKRWCEDNDNELIVVRPNDSVESIGLNWHNNILDQINEQTSVVLMSSLHWMNGIRFNLELIGKRCKEVGAKFIVDGTQSVGVLKMDVNLFHIDALVCASYKWLFGPYSIALAHISDEFANGKPLEESWINRTNAKNFSSLTEYEGSYAPNAGRYNVGETSNFILMPMLRESLKQVIAWSPEGIEEYCKDLTKPLMKYLSGLGMKIKNDEYFSSHLFSLKLPKEVDLEKLKQNLDKNNIIISIRGSFLRVSVNVFNDVKDIQKLIDVIDSSL